MIVISSLIVGFLLSFVVPKIIDVFNNSQQTLPLMTIILIYLSNGLQKYGLYILLFILFGAISFKYALRMAKFREKCDRLLLKLPIISYLIQTINISRYVHTFSILFASGVPVIETMNVATSLITNAIIKQQIEHARLRVKEGTAIYKALHDTTFVNAMTVHLIASGEKSGQLADMMERAALNLDHEVQRRIDLGLTLLEPFIILLMGGVVLFIVLATLLPIFSMDQLV